MTVEQRIPETAYYRLARILDAATAVAERSIGRNLAPAERAELVEWIADDYKGAAETFASTLP